MPRPAGWTLSETQWATDVLTAWPAIGRFAAEAQLERAVGFAEKHDDFAGEDIGELAAGGIDQEIGAGELAELARHAVELGGALFLTLRGGEARAELGRELADQEADAEHHAEGDEVLGVADGKREVRLHEKEIEGEDADDGGDDGGAAAEAGGDDGNADEKDHHDVGLGQAELVANPAEEAADGADDGGGAVVSPIDGAWPAARAGWAAIHSLRR